MRRIGFLLLLLVAQFLANPCSAMDLPTYDVDSLAYMSTDVVLATVQNRSRSQAPTLLVVRQVIHGGLRTGATLDDLDPFLRFFFPSLSSGQDVILFLDRRPRPPGLSPDAAARAPFAIVPSGMMLVDRAHRVFRYFQLDNPGGYILEGAESPFFLLVESQLQGSARSAWNAQRRQSTKRLLASLPTYDQVLAQIGRSENYVEPLRVLLDDTPRATDGRTLRDLIESRHAPPANLDPGSEFSQEAHRLADWITARAVEQLEALRDWPDLLDVYPQTRADGPVAFLADALDSEHESLRRRIYAARELASSAEAVGAGTPTEGWSRQGPSPPNFVDKVRLSPATAHDAERIHHSAARIFADAKEDRRLRGACAPLLDMADAPVAATVRRVYASTRSPDLRFSIEVAMLAFSDDLYEKLPGFPGPTTSMTEPAIGRIDTPDGKIRFVGAWLQERRQWKTEDVRHRVFRYALVNQDTGETRVFASEPWVDSGVENESFVLLDRHPDLPAGRYLLRLEDVVRDQVVGSGYPARLVVRSDGFGNRVLAAER